MDKLIDDLIKLAFAEDIGDGDHTTLCCIPRDSDGEKPADHQGRWRIGRRGNG